MTARVSSLRAKALRAEAGQNHLGLSSLPGRAARKAVREIRATLAPANIQRLRRKFVLPVRNAVLWHKPIAAHAAGHAIKLVPEGAIAAAIWSGADYQSAKLALLTRLLAANSVFLDVGANIGIFSLLASKVSPSAKILAFEPVKTTFDLLSQNVQLNDARNVTALHLALGNFPDKSTAPVVTLDDYLLSAALDRIDLIKVDAEGAERFVFEGAGALLQRPDAPLVLYDAFSSLTRRYDYHPVEIFWLLDHHGFSFFTLDPDSGQLAVPRASRAYDSTILAVKPSHPAYSKIEELAH